MFKLSVQPFTAGPGTAVFTRCPQPFNRTVKLNYIANFEKGKQDYTVTQSSGGILCKRTKARQHLR